MTDAEINDILLDFEKVRDFVTFKLVGRKTNEEKLKGIPHRDMGDMAIVYQVNMEKMGIPGSALINNGMMETYGKSAEDLEALAEENTPRIHPAHISSMEEVLGLPPDKTGNSLKMLVVTNDIASDPLPYGSREEVIDAEDRQEAGDSEKDHSVYPEGMTREKQWQAETLAEENQGWEQENRRVRQRESVIERLEEKKREIRDLKPLPREVSEKTWESPPAITELEKKNTGS
jgi:hypothetical protein